MTNEADLGIDHLTDVQMIGRGGFSVVYSASHTLFKRRMAVKLLNALTKESERLRFERECEVLGRLSDHRHVVSVYNAGYTTNDRPYLLMELVEGGTLQNQLDTRGTMPWREAVEYLVPICDALAAAHTEQILHRDVKPENILLTRDGEVRLADFGIASLRDATGATSTHITASMLHTAPETFENLRDERSDIYSLTSTLFHLIVGRAPFWHDSDISIHPLMNRLLNDPAPAIPADKAPAELSALVQRALAKDPAQRPQTADSFGRELQAILDGGEAEAPSEPEYQSQPTLQAGDGFVPPTPYTAGRTGPGVDSGPTDHHPPPLNTPVSARVQNPSVISGPTPIPGLPSPPNVEAGSGPVPGPRPSTGPTPPQAWSPNPIAGAPQVDDRGTGFHQQPHISGPTPVAAPPGGAGWYHHTGDPPGTQRFWTGAVWQGHPQPVSSAGGRLVGGQRLASPERRIIARLVDMLVWVGAWVLFLLAIIPTEPGEPATYVQILALGLFTTIAIAAYEIVFVTTVGATLGKLLVSIRVVSEDGTPAGFAGAAMRMVMFIVLSVLSAAVYFPLLIMLVIAGVAIASLYGNDRRQTMWDRHAKTVVVNR